MKLPSKPTLHLADLLPRGSTRWAHLAPKRSLRMTYTGRAALYQYFAALAQSLGADTRRVVLVPAFHCPTVVDPILHAGFDVRYYAINEQLQVNDADFLAKLDQRVAAAVFIRYFGLGDIPESLANATRTAGAQVLYDCSHSFLCAKPLSLAGTNADAAVYSFWKILPSATVGGGLWTANPSLHRYLPRERAPSRSMRAQLLRQLATEAKDNLLPQRATDGETVTPATRKSYEEAYPYDREASFFAMPWVVNRILRSASLGRVASARRENYRAFCEAFRSSPETTLVAPKLGDGDVPWGVPVILQKRYERDYLIRARGVPLFSFGEVLHPGLFAAGVGPIAMVDTARYLSEKLLAFSIHQQIDPSQSILHAQLIGEFIDSLH